MKEEIAQSRQETFAQMFGYSVKKTYHEKMLSVMGRLSRIYSSQGSLGMRLYVWGEEAFFHGFDEIGKQLGISSDDDLWLEVNCYENRFTAKESFVLGETLS